MMKGIDFKTCNILLTGGTGEIGHGFLKALKRRHPTRVFVPGSEANRLEQLRKSFPEFLIETFKADLSTKTGTESLAHFVREKLPLDEHVGLVIFGAGMLGVSGNEVRPSWENSLKTFALNCLSPDLCFRALTDLQLLKTGSTVIALGSISGHKSYKHAENLSTYSMSKAALHQAVMNWAKDHPEMTIFELALGAIQTKMLDTCRPPDMSTSEWQTSLKRDIPIQEVGDPEIVTETILRLLESPGHRLFHGDTLHLSGGERL